ncbi:hypothetical protein [Stenotrophomonas maltophilia]|uniref:hypothetical protein n=1 Tax=Stenotrophomonas maltophilia TaxID=40324 RepID=UPI0013D938D9|nr:hypothetical protein [Stenotrophomonas maltophilia]
MLGWNSKTAERRLGSTDVIANPFSQPGRKAQCCDRLRYIAGSAAVGFVPTTDARLG